VPDLIIGGYRPPYGCWELNSGLLEGLLSHRSSPQNMEYVFFFVFINLSISYIHFECYSLSRFPGKHPPPLPLPLVLLLGYSLLPMGSESRVSPCVPGSSGFLTLLYIWGLEPLQALPVLSLGICILEKYLKKQPCRMLCGVQTTANCRVFFTTVEEEWDLTYYTKVATIITFCIFVHFYISKVSIRLVLFEKLATKKWLKSPMTFSY